MRDFKKKEIIEILQKEGFVFYRNGKGAHKIYKRKSDGATFTIALHTTTQGANILNFNRQFGTSYGVKIKGKKKKG